MSYEPTIPDNNLVLRQLQGMRRDMQELMDRQARTIDPVNRVALRVNELASRTDKGFADVQSDIIMMENKVLTAQSDVLRIVRRLDEDNGSSEGADLQP